MFASGGEMGESFRAVEGLGEYKDFGRGAKEERSERRGREWCYFYHVKEKGD